MFVSVVMGSKSDYKSMRLTLEVLDQFQIPYECKIVSAHRTPELMFAYAKQAKDRGIDVIIAGAGGAAHLPGMIAALTIVPVIGVPIKSSVMSGIDSLYSIVQMPYGVAVATQAIGDAGAKNAGLMAAQMLAISHPELSERLLAFKQEQSEMVQAMELEDA
ncbi:MAG: 5-(carboxyamino)imidazole ribonucleotide mutase [Erysipelotrichaceae bacterium]